MNRAREMVSMNGEWEFAYTREAPDVFAKGCREGEPVRVKLPGPEQYDVKLPVPAYWDDCRTWLKYAKFWSRESVFNPENRRIDEFPLGGLKPPDASLPYLLGTGWYKRKFMVPADWEDKCVVLCLGGVMLDAWVWLNGEFTGTHYSCGKPFEIPLDDFLQYGRENEMVIAVSNTRTDRTGCSIRGFKGKSGGINGSIGLSVCGSARIKDCYVRKTDSDEKLQWMVSVHRREEAGLRLHWSILDADGKEELGSGNCDAGQERLSFETDLFGMKYWSDREPWLYCLRLELWKNEEMVDEKEQSFGLRVLERKGTGILLNGFPLFLRGTTDHAYFPETCTVSNDLAYYMRTIKALKAAGFNWMRFHTTVPPEECMEAADRLGMLIQAETQNGFTESDFIDMLLLCRKHPSVILYCCGNEVPITDGFEEKLRKMGEHCHTLAPDCLYDPMEALLNIECRLDEKAPGYTESPVPYNAVKLGRLREYSDVFATGVWVFSYHSLYPDVEKISERLSIYQRPCLIHEAGIFDTYLNLDLEKRYEGTRIGTELYAAVRKYVDEMGMLDHAPLYYRNSCKWMKLLMKFSLEKARRCQSVAGYDFLGAIDCHWHRTGYAVGVMNEFYELKTGFSFEELRQFNGESVLLSDAGHKRNLFVGEKLEVSLSASLYGGQDMEQGVLSWMLLDDKHEVRLSGECLVKRVKNGVLSELSRISIGLEQVRGIGEHFRLRAWLRGGSYAITNEWDYWIFDRAEPTDCRTVKELTVEDVKYMENGGRILLLGSGPFPGLPITFQITPGGRVNGNCATVIYEHPLMRDFPQEGYCDWQFMPLFRDAGAVVFNELDVEFNPVIEVVSTYKMIRKQAGIFEWKVGRGGMLVCTLNVSGEDPASKALYARMTEYLSSEEFCPGVEVRPEKLLKIMEGNKDIRVDFNTDECYDTGGHIEV